MVEKDPCLIFVLNFYQNFSNFFGGESCHQSIHFDILRSLTKVVAKGGTKDGHFYLFQMSSKIGLMTKTIGE